MESWVLEGDSYSFLCSAPRDFNLQHLDGPNHVEIFDITSIPSNRSAISETTCLCDIFGDECESPSLSSSPTTASFLQKDVDEQVPAEDVDDSSGSYHTANGLEHLSDGSDTFEDSKETKDSPLSESRESNMPASDLTLPNGSPKPRGYLQESCLSQDTSLEQAENSSVQQLVASTSEFRDTNIRVTGSAQNIISPDLLFENKGIRDQTYAISSEPWEPDLTEAIATPDLRCTTKQRDASSTEWMIIPDSLSEIRGETEQRDITASEVRETDSAQEHKHHKQSTFSENGASAEFFSNLGSGESPKGKNNDLGCSGEEEKKICLPDILSTENILQKTHVHKTVKSGSSDAWTNLSNDCSDSSLQKTVSDPSAKNETYDLTEMSVPLEYTGRLQPAHTGTFLCDDKPGLSDLEDPRTVEDNAETDRASVSDTTERLSESCSPSGPLVDVNSSEPSVIIHSPVGFSPCSSPEPKNNFWSTGPEDLAFTPENLESDCRLTPTDKSSVSSFDSKLCPTPEPGSTTYTPENRQNAFRYELGPAASSPELRSASCSPEIKIMACRSLTQPPESPQIENKAPQNDLTSQSEVLAQTHDIEGMPTESFMSAEEDMTLYNPLSIQGGLPSPSTTLPRDNMSPDLMRTRYPESPTSNILPANDSTNMAISSNLSSMDRCIISSHSPIGIRRSTESPDVHESSISTIPPTNETTNMDVSPVCHLSSTEGSISRSASTLSIPRDTASPVVMGTRYTESSMATTRPTNVDSSPILQPSSTEEGTFRPPSNVGSSRDTATPDVDCVRSPASTTVLTNDITIMALSPFSNHSSTGSNLSIHRDTMSPDEEGTRNAQSSMSTMLPIKGTEDVVISPITHLSSTEGGIPRSPSPSSILIDTMCPDKPGTGCVECSLSTRPPTNETRNMATSPISNPSSTDEGISRPSSTLSIPSRTAYPDTDGIGCVEIPTTNIVLINEITNMANSPINLSLTGGIPRPPSNLSISLDTTTLDVQETEHVEQSNEIPINETTNMAILPISNLSSTEEGISRPQSTSSIPRTIVFNDLEGLRCVESPTSTILPTNEAQNMGMSPIFNVSPTDMGLSHPPSMFSIPRDTIFPDVEETRYTKRSDDVPTNLTADMAVSNISSTDGAISRPPSTSNIPRTTVSTDVDGLRCVESPTSTILPKNEAPNMNLSNPPSMFSLPKDSISPGVQGTKYTKRSNEIPINEITNMDISKVSSTKEGISSPSTTLSITRDTMSSDVGEIRCVKNSTSAILPTSIEMAPVYILASAEGDSMQPLNLGIPRDSTCPARSNEVPTSSKMRYQQSPDRFKDHIPPPEMCIPQGYADNHLSTTISEKVDLPLMVPLVSQIDDIGSKMSLKSRSVPQDDCKDIALVPCNQGDSDLSPEKPAPKLSVKQIKENWEKMNESILNSLNPWQTSKKSSTVPTAKGAKEGNDSEREMLERVSAGSENTFGQMAMRPGESPSVLHSNNHSMYKGQSCRNKGWNGGRVIQEEHTLGKGVGNIAEGSYRGEQVELSFSTRNRKGPANHSPAPSSRDPKSAIPPRYFESPLATRRQQSLLRAQNLQKENKTGARRVRSTSQSNRGGAARLSSECASETSSMGSELDDADSEVKWFTDQAFRSLSSPQVDYLDVYNSSCGSSTNVSQPSTLDSPGSATWISYADLHDSLPENDDASCHTSSFLPHGTLDPAKRFEMGSFECVDVAVESKEETRRGKRMVPKRQIQFKRRNFDELKSESEEKAMDSLSTQTCSKDTLVRQHSTPASMQEDLGHGENEIQTGKKMLQKSASLDESSRKSKMASGVIKSVLSKKMDTASKEPSISEPCENKKKDIEPVSAGEASTAERQSFSLPSECSLSSDDFAGKEARSPHTQKRSCRPKVPPKPVFKANCLPFNNNPVGVAFQDKPSLKDQVRPIMVDAFESRISKKQPIGNPEKEASKVGEKYSRESGSAINRTPNCTAICVASTGRMTNSANKHPMTPETHKQQESSSSMFFSKTPEITLKACTIKDKSKSSSKASHSSELEVSKDTIHEPQLEETLEEPMPFKPGLEADDEEDEEKNKVKSVIHKVRDVRKLVKNTYNLTFKASNATNHVDDVVPEKQKETQPENPHPLHIECKAISWKDKTASCNKSTTQKDVAQICTADKSEMPQMDSQITKDVGFTKITARSSMPNIQHSDMDLFVGLDKCNSQSKPGNSEQNTKQEMPPRPSSKEISTLVFLQDPTPKSVQKPTCPASPNVKTANSIHSVSMLRKEKGMQADIGVCDILNERAGAKPKHINRLEVPLQTYASEGTSGESQKVKQEDADLLPGHKTSLNSGLQRSEGTLEVRNSPKPKEMRVLPNGKGEDNQSQGDLVQSPKERDITVAASSKARAFSSNAKIRAMPVTTSKEIELPIQVRSISSDRPKPTVLPKPSYKQPFAEIRSTSTDFPKTDITPTTSILKEQTHLKSDVKIMESSATVIQNEQSTNTTSSNTKTLAVSAVSSQKPQTIPVTTMSSTVQKSTATTNRQEVSITSVQNTSNQQQQEQVTPATPYASNYQTLPAVSQSNMQPTTTALSNNHLHTDDFHFSTADDPPSYDERESFSPLQLSDLPPRRQNRYHPTTKHSLCSCTSCTQPQFGQPYHGSQNQTPPAPRSPGQVISYPGAPPQAQVRPHQCRPDGQPLNYPSISPKTAIQQAPAMIQPMHHSHTCPAPAIQPYGNEQQQPSAQNMDRRSGNQRSPQTPSGAYREHSRSPNIAALDPRSQFFNPQELPPTFGNEYGSDAPGGGGVLYPENTSGLGYGQGPRRVLLDPETGKYFYIEVPMQPLRKMLFDPEIGQYVEVLIPQQAMSNSTMYPPSAAPYQGPYHGQGLYASQYLPYAMPPHSQSAQQPRHPEPTVPTSLHQNTMGYGSTASQVPKSDVKGHPSLDQSYLESMYYIPTGMNASPNSTPSDCYHKPATNMPAAGGRRA